MKIRYGLRHTILCSALWTLSAIWCSIAPARAETFQDVASPADFASAVQALGPNGGAGVTLRLAAGDYGALMLKDMGGAAGAPLTITSADPAHPATFSHMDMRQIHDVVLDNLTFDYAFTLGDPENLRAFEISDSQNVTIRASLFDGDTATGVSQSADGFPTAFALAFRNVDGATLENSEIRLFLRGLVVSGSKSVTIQGNNLHDLRSDGMDFAEVSQVVIEGNHIHDFRRMIGATDHADMIQFWTNGTKTPSQDISIRGNVLNSGHGLYTQSIFIRNDLVDRGMAGDEMFYRNIRIENNVIINAHLYGISVGETHGLQIRNNTVIRNAISQGAEDNIALWTPQIRVAVTSTEVMIERNVAHKITGYAKQSDWQVRDNFLIQDRYPAQPGFYDTVFAAARTGDPSDLANFTYLAGGPVAGMNMGAPQLEPGAKDGVALEPQAVIRLQPDESTPGTYSLDGSVSVLPAGVAAGDVHYNWAFDDGLSATGVKVQHAFTATGPHKVTLTLTLPDGNTLSGETSLYVKGPEVVGFSSASGLFTSYVGRDPEDLTGVIQAGGPAVLGQGMAPLQIPRDKMATFFGSTAFRLSLDLHSDGGYKAAGELLRIHNTLIVTLSERGVLDIRFDTATAAPLKIKTTPVRLEGPGWHKLDLEYSAKTGAFTVSVDGKVVGKGVTSGSVRPLEFWGLSFGNPFGNAKSFDGELNGMSLVATGADGTLAAN